MRYNDVFIATITGVTIPLSIRKPFEKRFDHNLSGGKLDQRPI
jgi:hypothetical protein